jgi:hypothetical protein
MDGTGLLAGPLEEGVGSLDSTAMHTGADGTQFLNGYLIPATGPTPGGTQTSWSYYGDETAAESISFPAAGRTQTSWSTHRMLYTLGSLPGVYFGSQNASSVSASSGTISVTTPPGAPGPADVCALASDGGVQVLPEAFSYGPTVLEITPNAATADGGMGVIFGHGLGPVNSNNTPSNLQVTVGGKSAALIALIENVYSIDSPPFQLQAVTYQIPAGGTAGSATNVSVNTNSGSVTVQSGITYLPAVQQYPLSGVTLAQGIYDSRQDVYYFTDATKIQVFSGTAGTWMNPISIPAADAPQRLWGIALSPDGSKLAIADALGTAIYVLTPNSPTVVAKFPFPQPQAGAAVGLHPVASLDKHQHRSYDLASDAEGGELPAADVAGWVSSITGHEVLSRPQFWDQFASRFQSVRDEAERTNLSERVSSTWIRREFDPVSLNLAENRGGVLNIAAAVV